MGALNCLPELDQARFVVRGAQEGDEARLNASLKEAGGAKLRLFIGQRPR
jgi:hypothetical protein